MKHVIKFTAIGFGGLLSLVIFLGVVGAFISGDGDTRSSPPEHAEKHKGVERADTQQAKQPTPQEIQKEESGAGPESGSRAHENNKSVHATGPTVKITRVLDGDTIKISPAVGGKNTVRLIGVDAPEEEKPGCGAQPLAREAKDLLANWEGSKVKLEFDQDRTDQHGRLLAYVRDPQTQIMLNLQMVVSGYAQVYIVPPNTKHEDELREAQKRARDRSLSNYSIEIWSLPLAKASQLADHGNGVGYGDGACPPKP